METSYAIHFCDGALLASFDALGRGWVAVNASDGIVAFAPGPRGLRLVALGGALGGGDKKGSIGDHLLFVLCSLSVPASLRSLLYLHR